MLVITGELADGQIFVYGQKFASRRRLCLEVPEIGDWPRQGVVILHSPRPKLVEPNAELLGPHLLILGQKAHCDAHCSVAESEINEDGRSCGVTLPKHLV